MNKPPLRVNRQGNPEPLWEALNAGLPRSVAPKRRFREVKIAGAAVAREGEGRSIAVANGSISATQN